MPGTRGHLSITPRRRSDGVDPVAAPDHRAPWCLPPTWALQSPVGGATTGARGTGLTGDLTLKRPAPEQLSPTRFYVIQRLGRIQQSRGVVETHVEVGVPLAAANESWGLARSDIDATDGAMGQLFKRKPH